MNSPGALIRSILFVCAGNICRSPLAEAAFRDIARSRPPLADITVGSAGVMAMTGNPATTEAVEIADEAWGVDLSAHRARNIEGLDGTPGSLIAPRSTRSL